MSNFTSNRSVKIEGANNSILLKHLADKVSTGTTPSGSISTSDNGINKLIQSKDINHNHLTVSPMQLAKTDWGTDNRTHYLDRESIIVFSRGAQPIANVFLGDKEDKAVVSNTFFVISLSDSAKELLRPEYVAWYINYASESKRHFEINAKGTNLLMTSIQTLRELPIFIPLLKEQDRIVNSFVQTQYDIDVLKRMIALRREHNHAYSAQLLHDSFNRQSSQPDYM